MKLSNTYNVFMRAQKFALFRLLHPPAQARIGEWKNLWDFIFSLSSLRSRKLPFYNEGICQPTILRCVAQLLLPSPKNAEPNAKAKLWLASREFAITLQIAFVPGYDFEPQGSLRSSNRANKFGAIRLKAICA